MFTGEYRHAVDEKGRVAVPARFRGQLEAGAYISKWIDGCLAIHTRDGFAAFADRVAGLPVADAGARTFSRFVYSSAFELELDRQGRIVVPAGLREWAGLGSEAVIVGARDHIELWEARRWADYSAAMNSPEVLAEHLQGLGI